MQPAQVSDKFLHTYLPEQITQPPCTCTASDAADRIVEAF
jgi:hypothetical protein